MRLVVSRRQLATIQMIGLQLPEDLRAAFISTVAARLRGVEPSDAAIGQAAREALDACLMVAPPPP